MKTVTLCLKIACCIYSDWYSGHIKPFLKYESSSTYFFFSHCSIICNLPWLVIRLSADFTWNNSDSLLSIFRFLFSQLKALREICFLPWIYLNTIHWQTVSINLFWSSTFFLMDELKKQFCFESLFFLRFYVFDSCSFPSSFLQAVTCVTICYYPSKLYPIG